ncbi:uncharacterized protein LOC124837670 [Vigna umbellata]|uniref:Uncharacterized protein n=3 Tax=Phaseolus angularis TaxID=3914 RepID=A0A0L9TQV1_PHAAN|nr:uncharacterized protein LOC108331765 isoform X1 [Vigna angularis]XP_047169052.1 uncharacterized protein LOC124837670 [Vigna umbellata]KAG2408082.1 uncharacterized protein HKW66_Vig0029040 [Vigna angularis]KOM32876.1 hypothetical protein LR48_Vigan01g243200 [Vigna angularis]BAT76169.1 hypothetical protein VIGAN_01413600 [Vigna angularis var. angularis]
MKKMKAVVSMDPPYDLYQDQRTRLRHHSLLQDYEDLHKETEVMRRKLQDTEHKRLILEDEVRFLRQRYKYLLKHPIPKPQPKKEVVKSQKVKIQAPIISKGKNYSRKDHTSRSHSSSHLNPNGKISNVAEVPLQKTSHLFDLNQNARNFSSSKKDSTIHGSASPALDLNHKERIHSSKEATKKSVTPFFDLNQISREEEELQGNSEPMRIEEPKRSTQRVGSDEQHNDIKLSACRSVGDGANRAGKRKISWQDQVALRV